MKIPPAFFLLFLSLASATAADRRTDLVILDATAVKNLRLETAVAEETTFEETVFALGRIEADPARVAAVTSRIAGRIEGLAVSPGQSVRPGEELARIESRLAGNPPPGIVVSAPIGGLVTHLDIRRGAPVEPDRALLEITDLREVLAVARVPQHAAGRIPPGARAHITVAAAPGAAIEGTFLRFGTSADETSGTIDAIFSLPNPDARLRPGMRAEFAIVTETRANVLAVPCRALQGDPANRFVYVKDFDLPNAFLKTPVTVGATNDRFVEITGGLFPADEVVTTGAYSLAFAGGGSVSLKEALDAAHGHEHNPDGSEITAATKPAGATSTTAATMDLIWPVTSSVLLVLLILSLVLRPRRSAAAR